MRQIGITPGRPEAEQFSDYLMTQGISAHVEPGEGNSWTIWVHQEDHLDNARKEFQEFLAHPQDPRFQNVASQARNLRKQDKEEQRASAKRVVDMRQRWAGPRLRDIPLTVTLIAISILVGVLTDLGSDNQPLVSRLMFHSQPTRADILAGKEIGPPLEDIQNGEVWRLVTPIFLHFSGLHILFNMLWLHSLGGRIEFLLNKWRLLVMVLIIAAVSNTAQAMLQSPSFGGMSGVVYGLFVYVWLKGVFEPRSAFGISPGDVIFMGIWLVMGMSDPGLRMANWAHLFGAIAGGVIAIAETQLRTLLRK